MTVGELIEASRQNVTYVRERSKLISQLNFKEATDYILAGYDEILTYLTNQMVMFPDVLFESTTKGLKQGTGASRAHFQTIEESPNDLSKQNDEQAAALRNHLDKNALPPYRKLKALLSMAESIPEQLQGRVDTLNGRHESAIKRAENATKEIELKLALEVQAVKELRNQIAFARDEANKVAHQERIGVLGKVFSKESKSLLTTGRWFFWGSFGWLLATAAGVIWGPSCLSPSNNDTLTVSLRLGIAGVGITLFLFLARHYSATRHMRFLSNHRVTVPR